jgi:glutamine synthetase
MRPHSVNTPRDARQIVEELGLEYVKVGVFDADGILRGKFMSREKFLSALESGFGFCDVVLGWDSDDQLYDNVEVTGWHSGYPDAQVAIIPDSCRNLPFEYDGKGLLFLGDFVGQHADVSPRRVLQRVVERGLEMGFEAIAGFEYEFFLFEETPRSAAEKNYLDLMPISPGNFGYSVLRASTFSDFHTEFLDICNQMDFPLEGLHTETGPGVMEAAITKASGLAAADRGALFKTFAKVIAQRHGMMATFMARWSPDYPGQSGHLHLSLKAAKDTGTPFHDGDAPQTLSSTMRHFIGGQQALLPEFLALVAPTVNSYTRMVPGFWAPTASTWGVDNRTCAIRAILGKPAAQRIEYRIAAADGNPYLVMAAALASGLHGIAEEIEPTNPIDGNAYESKGPARLKLPETLWQAAQKLRRSRAARTWLGDSFVEHYAASREWEEREYRKAITDWQLKRYFEII